MKRKDILELKRRFKKEDCTFTKISGCYVNSEKNIILNFKENFLNLDEAEYFKYLEIAKKILSGTLGNNILELNFQLNENLESEKQISLMEFKKSKLNDDLLLQEFYKSIIENYNYEGNFLILVFHDVYDIMTKTSDNLKLDESEEVYEYILCAICPVSLSDPGLIYLEEEQKIKARMRDWVVDAPTLGFVYPAFIDRSSDVNSIIYYTKNPKKPHPELMEKALGCFPKQTKTIQKNNFKALIESSMDLEEEDNEEIFMEIQENLNNMVEEHKEIYGDTDVEPIALDNNNMKNILMESGIPEEVTNIIEDSFEKIFEEEPPLVENLIDSKILKAGAQRKKEKHLKKQVEILQNRLEEKDKIDSEYDIVLKVNPNKVSEIKTEVINGQKCIIIPVEENEQAKINDLDDLI